MKSDGPVKLIVGFALLIGGAEIVTWMPPTWSSRFASSSVEAQPAPDRQEVVLLAPLEREVIRREMRTMLRALSLMLQGLAVGDFEMVEHAARTSGNSATLDPALAGKLPTHFVELDTKLHTRFEQIADAIKTGGRGDLSRRLAALTGYCVACHEMYRLEERP